MNFWQRGFFAVLISALASCTLIIGDSVLVDKVPEPSEATVSQILSGVTVRLQRFSDKRKLPEVARIGDRTLTAEGDVGLALQSAFERYIKAHGGRVSLFDAAVTLTGEINEWCVVGKPEFPATQLKGSANIHLEVYDAYSRLLFKGEYSGTQITTHPLPSQTTVEDVLSGAMKEALNEVFADSRLTDALSAGQR